ncbi:MAG: LCCL domain-containing protein [Alphaproteobacteria bacterium]|nr:LCCL domain-containing protein [Alphaproteobacteria bacterium]
MIALLMASWLAAQPVPEPSLTAPDREPSPVEIALERYNRGEVGYEAVLAAEEAAIEQAEAAAAPIIARARRENAALRTRMEAAIATAVRAEGRTDLTPVSHINEDINFVGDSYTYALSAEVWYVNERSEIEYTQEVGLDRAGPLRQTAYYRSARAIETAFNSIEWDDVETTLSYGPYRGYIARAQVIVDGVVRGRISINEEGRPYMIEFFDETGEPSGVQDYSWLAQPSSGDPEGLLQSVQAPQARIQPPGSDACSSLFEQHADFHGRAEASAAMIASIVREHRVLHEAAIENARPVGARVMALRLQYPARRTEFDALVWEMEAVGRDLDQCLAEEQVPGAAASPSAPASQPSISAIADGVVRHALLSVHGDVFEGAPNMEVRLDRTLVLETEVEGPQTFEFPILGGVQEVSVRFTNDRYHHERGDRNLRDINLRVDGVWLSPYRNTGGLDRTPGPHLFNSGAVYFALADLDAPEPASCSQYDPRQGWMIVQCGCEQGWPRGEVVGDGVYRAGSDICTAALHAGVIGTQGGTVRVYRAFGRDTFGASERNTVSTLGGGGAAHAFTFEHADSVVASEDAD